MATLTADEKRKLDSDSSTNHNQVDISTFVAFSHGMLTLSGGTKVETITGVEATDTPIVTGVSGTISSALKGVCTANTLTVTGTGTEVVSYVIYKAA